MEIIKETLNNALTMFTIIGISLVIMIMMTLVLTDQETAIKAVNMIKDSDYWSWTSVVMIFIVSGIITIFDN
jgi:ABC-type uncharacterized transport system permease subunit